jgi:salicylate hydroxylase
MTFRRWEDGESIGYTKLFPEFRDNFDAPYYVIHRADLHEALQKLARQHGVDLEVNCKVVKYDPGDGKVTTLNGRTFSGDLVIGADGNYSSWNPTCTCS